MRFTKFLRQGSVSEGSCNPRDTIPALADALRAIHLDEGSQPKEETALLARAEAMTDFDGDDAGDILDELYNVLDGYSPPGRYFGSHEGDGAAIGWWPVGPGIVERQDVVTHESLEHADIDDASDGPNDGVWHDIDVDPERDEEPEDTLERVVSDILDIIPMGAQPSNWPAWSYGTWYQMPEGWDAAEGSETIKVFHLEDIADDIAAEVYRRIVGK